MPYLRHKLNSMSPHNIILIIKRYTNVYDKCDPWSHERVKRAAFAILFGRQTTVTGRYMDTMQHNVTVNAQKRRL